MSDTTQPVSLDVMAIQALIPHRYPFLMVDRVDSYTHERLVARKMVTINEHHFIGHYPGTPVMPGVLMIEALAQAGALMAAQAGAVVVGKHVIYLMGVDKVKFRRAVVPGDMLTLEVEPLRRGSSIWKLKGRASVDGETACEAEFLAGIQARP